MSESKPETDCKKLLGENEALQSKLREAEETLNAIRNGDVDAIVVSGKDGDKVFSLTSAETPYRIVLEEMDEGALIVSKAGIVLYCNPRFAEMVSIPREKISGSSVTDLISSDDRVRFRKLFKESFMKRIRGIVKLISGINKSVDIQISIVPLPSETGGDLCIMALNITTLKNRQTRLQKMVDERTFQLETVNKKLQSDLIKLEETRTILRLSSNKYRLLYKKMQLSETKYKELVQNARTIILKLNNTGKITFFNEYAQSFFGFTEEEMIGRNVIGTIVPYIESTGRDLEKFLEGMYKDPDKYAVNINENIKKTGERVWIEWYNKSIYNKSGERNGHIAIGIDITKRVNAEKNLKASEEKLDIALECGHIGIWERNLLTDEVIWDNRMGRIFGIEPGLYPRNFTEFEELIHENDLSHFRKAIDISLKTGSLFETVFRTRSENGNSKYISTKALLNRDDKGNCISFTGICFDVTVMKQGAEYSILKLNEELLRSNRELENFAYIASHDLQEPLRMVSSFTQMLEKRYADKLDQDAKDYIKYAVDGAKRMYDLINGLLDYSRIQTKGKNFSKVKIADVLENVITNLSLKIEDKNVVISKTSLPVIVADEQQMLQLLQNLIENSIKFSPVNPKIHISSKVENGNYIFAVKDEGMGIDPQYFDRIFKIFQRLMPKEEYEGTGIGLAICKRIVERHNGKLWVESEPGRGSTFFFTIPKQ